MHGFTVVFLLLVLVGCESKYDEKMAFGTLERDRIELTAETSEPISAVYVQEGQMVTQGTVLVQQDPARAEVALAKARADEAVSRAALMEAEAGPRQQQILGARARLEAESSADPGFCGSYDSGIIFSLSCAFTSCCCNINIDV